MLHDDFAAVSGKGDPGAVPVRPGDMPANAQILPAQEQWGVVCDEPLPFDQRAVLGQVPEHDIQRTVRPFERSGEEDLRAG